MSDLITLRFNGLLIAQTPVATCPPGTKVNKNDPAPVPKMSVDGTNRPYLPGGALRGTFRRKGCDFLRTELSVDGMSPFNLDDHYYLVLGGVKGDEKEDKVDILNAHARRLANPLIGLFGSGDPWQKGHLYVSHAVPGAAVGVDAIRGARVDDFARSGESLQLLSPDERDSWLETAKANNIRSKKLKLKGLIESLTKKLTIPRKAREELDEYLSSVNVDPTSNAKLEAHLKILESEIAKLNDVAGWTNAINRPLDGYEVIPVGTEMNQSLDLNFCTMDEVGLFMGALRYWALDPWVGAHKAHGCGVVSGNWTVTMRKGYAREFTQLGAVTMTPFEGIKAPDMLEEAEEVFLAALRSEKSRFDFKYQASAA